MVTLQILVLSFLVRIQVAQLKRLSIEGRFFVVWLLVVVVAAERLARSWKQMLLALTHSTHPTHNYPILPILPKNRTTK